MRTATVLVLIGYMGLGLLGPLARATDSPHAAATTPAASAPAAPAPNKTEAAAASAGVTDAGTSPAAAADSGKATLAPTTAPSPAAPAAAAAAEGSEADRAEEKHLLAMGYRPQLRNGTTYYCKSEMVVGSRIEKKVCTTPEEHRLRRQTDQDVATDAQHKEVNIVGH